MLAHRSSPAAIHSVTIRAAGQKFLAACLKVLGARCKRIHPLPLGSRDGDMPHGPRDGGLPLGGPVRSAKSASYPKRREQRREKNRDEKGHAQDPPCF